MPGPYHNIVLTMPGKQIGDIVAGLVRGIGYSAIEVTAARRKARRVFNDSLYRNLRRVVFPAVQRRLTVRSGRLKRSFRMLRQGPDTAVFKTVFYGQQKVVRPRPGVTVRGAIIEEFARRWRRAYQVLKRHPAMARRRTPAIGASSRAAQC